MLQQHTNRAGQSHRCACAKTHFSRSQSHQLQKCGQIIFGEDPRVPPGGRRGEVPAVKNKTAHDPMERDATCGWQRPLSRNVQRQDYGVRASVHTIKKKPKSSLCPWPAGIAWFHVATSMLAGLCQNCQRLCWHLNSGDYCRIMSVPWHGAVYRGGFEYHQQKAQEDASGNRLAWNEEDAGV